MFRDIAAAFVTGDYELAQSVKGVAAIDRELAKNIAGNIAAYGDDLALLDEETWERSVCLWMDGYWQILVDLSTTQERVSDLTLHAKLYEGSNPRLEITSVHVP